MAEEQVGWEKFVLQFDVPFRLGSACVYTMRILTVVWYVSYLFCGHKCDET